MRRLTLFLLLASGLLATPVVAEDTLILYMTEIPGQTMLDDEEPGVALDIVRVATERAGLVLKERFAPWPRAVAEAERSKNSLIIPFARTPARTDRFIWIAELYRLQFGFVSLGQTIDDLEAGRRLPRLGVWRSTYMEEQLVGLGFGNLVPVPNDQALARMLIRGRFDAWYGSLNEAAYKFRGIEEINKSKIRFGKPVSESPIWLAGGLDLSQQSITKLRHAVRSMAEDGTLLEILREYGMEDMQIRWE